MENAQEEMILNAALAVAEAVVEMVKNITVPAQVVVELA